MANALKTLFQDIADAIKEKTGETATMKPAEFPSKISAIPAGGSGGEQPKLFTPSLSRSGTTVTITNPASNGGFVEKYRVYDGDTLFVEQASKTIDVSGFSIGEHLLTVEACGENFATSDKSAVLNASKYAVSVTLENVTSNTIPQYMWHGESLTITLTPADGYALPKTVTATVGGDSSVAVYDVDNGYISIASVTGDVVVAVSGITFVTLEDTPWDVIAEYAENGTIQDKFSVGDTKTLALTYKYYSTQSETYTEQTKTFTMEIVGFNHDDLADGSGKAGVTFISKECTDNYYFSFTSGANTYWESSYLRKSLNDDAKESMPSTLRDRVKQVIKQSDKQSPMTTPNIQAAETSDYLWIPSLQEVGGKSTSYTVNTLGVKYELTYTQKTQIDSDVTSNYVTRNLNAGATNFYQKNVIYSNGTTKSSSTTTDRFCFGFCL